MALMMGGGLTLTTHQMGHIEIHLVQLEKQKVRLVSYFFLMRVYPR